MTQEELIQAISEMTVLELSELVKALEDKFGVSASAPMAMAAMPGMMGGGEAAPAEEEKTEFSVVLTAVGDQKIQVIKAVRELTSLGLREAKAVVDDLGTVLEDVAKEEAEAAKEKIEAAGATVELK